MGCQAMRENKSRNSLRHPSAGLEFQAIAPSPLTKPKPKRALAAGVFPCAHARLPKEPTQWRGRTRPEPRRIIVQAW